MGKNVCKSCGRPLIAINKFYVCSNPECKFEGLLRVNLDKDFKHLVEVQYAAA